MPFAPRALVLLIAAVVAMPTMNGGAQGTPTIDAIVARYSGGERQLFPQVFPTAQAFRDLRAELFQKTRDWRAQWTPSGPTFMLELSVWAMNQSWPDAAIVLLTAGDIVSRRTAPVGSSPEQDAYEITFHRTAVALLTGAHRFTEAERYLTMVNTRVVPQAAPGGALRLIDPRVALERAMLTEAQTAPGTTTARQGALPSLIVSPGNSATRTQLEQLVSSYEVAARLPEIAAEAKLRHAFVLHRLGRNAEALAMLAQVADVPQDVAISYWRELFTGRVLESVRRTDEAAAAYLRARSVLPTQTPAVALAALYERSGDHSAALRWADEAKGPSAAPFDPWWQYWSGDLRRSSGWIAELRRAGA
ncbi:MAG: tetratricopeptide repeat protein [Vicinamibacterales bacterium]